MFALSVGFDPALYRKLLTRKQLGRFAFVLRLLLIVLILLACAYTLSESMEGFFSSRSLIADLKKQIEIEKANITQSNVFVSKRDFSKFENSDVFGTTKKPTQTKPANEPKPVSNVPLNLIGTFVSDDSSAYAIIEDKKKKVQEVFNKGELIFGEATLVKIFADYVEIKRGEKIEILALDDSALPATTSADGGVLSTGENEFIVDEAELNTALEDLPLLLTQARAVPYFRDGRAIGLRMFAIKSDSLYQKLGLRNGDILKTVNENSLANIQEAMKLFETLKQERSIHVELERNKQDLEFRYSIK
ncbi:MAG: hypothetical protein KDD56_00375 [Bdellovibrionales bacterium]|nr:hypothetical protein [Bdellovibrionales bacterium]